MTTRTRTALAAVLLTGTLVLPWTNAQAPAPAPSRAGEIDMKSPDRFLVHVSTDKPIYRTGEKAYLRAVLLRATDHTPLTSQTASVLEILGPKGDTVFSGFTTAQDSVLAGAWTIPDEQPGGEYTARFTFPFTGEPPAERKFDIRAYRAPRLKSQIVFVRDGYGPGDTVSASLHAERAEGGIPANAKVTAVARVDGNEVHRSDTKLDAAGNCSVRFPLPKEISRGEGSLALIIEDGGTVETASKTIPILLQTLDLGLFPEGGDLIAGVEQRVYFQALRPDGKPADISGVIEGLPAPQERRMPFEVAPFKSEHEGRGRFSFSPERGRSYQLRINTPTGIARTFPLPEVKATGAVLRADSDIYKTGQPISFTVVPPAGTKAARLALSHRGVEIAASKMEEGWRSREAGVYSVQVDPKDADGILIATLYDDASKPLAERLIYRQPAKGLNIKVAPAQPKYIPGEKVSLTVTATDDAGKPVAAVVGLTVTDESVLEMIDKREQAPRLPAMVLLESDVRELADAHVYLDPGNPKAPLATDLLLGTQGWRRFATVDPAKFVVEHKDAGQRALALRIPIVPPRPTDTFDAVEGGLLPGGVRLGAIVRAPVQPPAAKAEKQDIEKKKIAELVQIQKDIASEVAAGKPSMVMDAKQARRSLPVIREYAHTVLPGRKPGDRVDFAETLYWSAATKTDPKTGQATVSFGLSDSVTSFRVSADAFDNRGALGAAAAKVESVQPFYIEAKLPLEVTDGDMVRLPVSVVNGTSAELPSVKLSTAPGKGFTMSPGGTLAIKPNDRVRKILDLKIHGHSGAADIAIEASADGLADKVTRPLRIKPLGFPVEVAHGAVISADAAITRTFTIPASVVPGSVTADLAIYPTPLANMTSALERLMQEPYGCFEQTSSTTYPLVMAQQYFMTHTGVDPKIIERSRELLDKGYKRLISFECKNKGFEWFGSDPGHEALSAFGLMEFSDLSRVQTVDAAMLANTRSWVLKTRDGQGGFKRERPAMHTWIQDKDCSNAYILWTLLETGEKGLEAEVATVKAAGEKSTNSYVVALAANDMALAGDKAAAKALMDKLAANQTDQGLVDGATTSIVGSGGEALQIETTALAALAWLRDPAYAPNVEKAIKWIAESCKAGRYGSTQSTVLALRAIVAYDHARAHPKAPGTVQVYVDGKPMGTAVPFDDKTQGAIKLPDIAEMLEPGDHKLEIKMTGGSPMPLSMAVKYHATRPDSSDQCRLRIAAKLRNDTIDEGAITEAAVTITNTADEAVPTPIALVGIPGGLEVRHDQLKELVKSGKIAAYEVLNRDVVLYWRELKSREKVELPLSLVAAIPGNYTGPASRTYLYYTDEFKQWSPGMKVVITPKGE